MRAWVTALEMVESAGGGHLLAQDDSTLFLGEDFWPWMILAFGAAMVVGNVLALVRPPTGAETSREGKREHNARPRPPLGRSFVLIVVGLAAAAWGLASLLA